MLRFSVACIACLLSAPVLADKIVNPDGDSYIETNVAQLSVPDAVINALKTLDPVSSAEAATIISPADVPLMRDAPVYDITKEFNGYYAEVPGQQ